MLFRAFSCPSTLAKSSLYWSADRCGGLPALDLMGHDLGIAASLGNRQTRDHNNLSCRDMIVVGKAGKLFDFLGIRVEINAQFGADIRDGFSRLQFVVDKITDNTVAHGCRPHGRGGSGSHDSRLWLQRRLS